jgi:hypothetical protein
MPGRVVQGDDERVEVVGQTIRRGGVAGPIELAAQRLESLPSVALVDGLIEAATRSNDPSWRETEP